MRSQAQEIIQASRRELSQRVNQLRGETESSRVRTGFGLRTTLASAAAAEVAEAAEAAETAGAEPVPPATRESTTDWAVGNVRRRVPEAETWRATISAEKAIGLGRHSEGKLLPTADCMWCSAAR